MKKLLLLSGLALSTTTVFVPMAQAAPRRAGWHQGWHRYSLETSARRIKQALRNDPIIGRFKLDTDTVDRHIEIEGKVNTQAQRRRATNLGKRYSGGHPVWNSRIFVR